MHKPCEHTYILSLIAWLEEAQRGIEKESSLQYNQTHYTTPQLTFKWQFTTTTNSHRFILVIFHLVNFHWILGEGTSLDFMVCFDDFKAICISLFTVDTRMLCELKAFLHEDKHKNRRGGKICEKIERKLWKILGKFFRKLFYCKSRKGGGRKYLIAGRVCKKGVFV